MSTKVKICGITNLEDAMDATFIGADALGFVFVKDTPRYIALKKASDIIARLPPFLSKVGLFVNPTTDEVEEALSKCNFNLIQFHGDEKASFCQQFNVPYIKAVSVKSGVNLIEYAKSYQSASAILLDTYSEELRGGSGNTFDWNLIPQSISKPIIIAGGLNKDNVKHLLSKITPYAIDVSSGVEIKKGKKDYQMMEKFILGVRNATL